ncbi:hypothetical protein GGR56DRAFT_346204 [Xylariaceae sp. FL0804]|nr:hypothetical protein GGR56DRAFT_346204 [Xylariaceae sp. FL0804]
MPAPGRWLCICSTRARWRRPRCPAGPSGAGPPRARGLAPRRSRMSLTALRWALSVAQAGGLSSSALPASPSVDAIDHSHKSVPEFQRSGEACCRYAVLQTSAILRRSSTSQRRRSRSRRLVGGAQLAHLARQGLSSSCCRRRHHRLPGKGRRWATTGSAKLVLRVCGDPTCLLPGLLVAGVPGKFQLVIVILRNREVWEITSAQVLPVCDYSDL